MKIVITEAQLSEYEARGYKRSPTHPSDVMGAEVWALIPPADTDGLIVMEAHDAHHKRVNSLPRKHMFSATMERMMVGAEIVPYYMLETTDGVTVAARSDHDSMPRELRTEWLHDTSREAAQSGKELILEAISAHESAIYVLKQCLVTMEIQ